MHPVLHELNLLVALLLLSEVFIRLLLYALLEDHVRWRGAESCILALVPLPAVLADLYGTGLSGAYDSTLIGVFLDPVSALDKDDLRAARFSGHILRFDEELVA